MPQKLHESIYGAVVALIFILISLFFQQASMSKNVPSIFIGNKTDLSSVKQVRKFDFASSGFTYEAFLIHYSIR